MTAAASRKRPQDLTGRTAEILASQHADELKARSGQIALLNAAAEEEKEGVVDYTDAPTVPVPAAPTTIEYDDAVEVSSPTRTFRVNTELRGVTIGVGTHYDFDLGQRYTAPKHVYDHLEEKGLIWH